MRYLAAMLIVAAPLTLAACGGSKNKQANVPPAVAVHRAATKTTARTGTVDVGGQQATVTGSGDFKGRDGTLRIGFNAGGFSSTVDAVLQGTTLYMRSPLLAATLKKGKTWLKVDLASASGSVGGMPLSSLAGESPAQTLTQLGALRNVTKVGAEKVTGTDATHYRGTVASSATAAGGTYDVWVGNDDGLIHRIKAVSKLGANQTVDATIDLSDFGKSVTVTVPPVSQTQTGG
jgi:hypothetical protein